MAKQVPRIGFIADLKEVILFSSPSIAIGNADEDMFQEDALSKWLTMKLMYARVFGRYHVHTTRRFRVLILVFGTSLFLVRQINLFLSLLMY